MHNASNEILEVFLLPEVWSTERACQLLQSSGRAESKRTAERRLHELGLVPQLLDESVLVDENDRPVNSLLLSHKISRARSKRALVLFLQLHTMPNGVQCLHANDPRCARYWVPLDLNRFNQSMPLAVQHAIELIQKNLDKELLVLPCGSLTAIFRNLGQEPHFEFPDSVYKPVLSVATVKANKSPLSPHLQRLEAESVHIIREAVAESENPVMLYSIGKDSAVMLHLARKAFFPGSPPFPLLHVDTRWKFQEMYLFRDYMAKESGMELIVHINPDAIQKNINPFDHGSALHTDITKTEGLKQALDQHKFDVIFGGARRDEEKSRAKERIFSFRSSSHRWDPKQQRPELWSLYNTRKNKGESIRVFPLSNWTELDIWQYIHFQNIPVVPLYFAKKRPVVNRDGMLLMIDDDRFKLLPGEEIQERIVRFRTLGCYPLTGAVESEASSLTEIILELINASSSERQGRAIDSDSSASMEKKKQEGYF